MQFFLQILLILLLVFFSVSNSTDHFYDNHLLDYMLLGIITVIIHGNLTLHTSYKEVRTVLKNMTFTILGFALLRIVKLNLPDSYDTIGRFLQYCFYPCLLLLGYYCMRIVHILDTSLGSQLKSAWFKYIFAIDMLVIAIVFTNDFHQLLLVFNENFHDSNNSYSFGVLEWPVKIYIMLQFILAVFLLLLDALRFSYFKKEMLIPLGILIYAIFYQVCYSLYITPFRGTETVLVTCFSIIAFWYYAFTTGLIIFNDKYMELFYASGIYNKIAAARLRQYLFMKLESIVAEEKNTIFESIKMLKAGVDREKKLLLLQHLRLSASLIKKQCLMFLQGEIYGFVPLADFQASLKEGLRYAKEYNRFFSLNIKVDGKGYLTVVSLVVHNIIMQAFMTGLKNGFDDLLINVIGDVNKLEVIIMMDPENREELEKLHRKFVDMLKYKGPYSISVQPTEDAISLRLLFEEAEYAN